MYILCSTFDVNLGEIRQILIWKGLECDALGPMQHKVSSRQHWAFSCIMCRLLSPIITRTAKYTTTSGLESATLLMWLTARIAVSPDVSSTESTAQLSFHLMRVTTVSIRASLTSRYISDGEKRNGLYPKGNSAITLVYIMRWLGVIFFSWVSTLPW